MQNIRKKDSFTGVTFNKQSKKWVARIMHNYNGKQLGTFNTQAEAHTFIGKTNKGKIARVCGGKMNSYYGYKWRYNYEDTNNKSA